MSAYSVVDESVTRTLRNILALGVLTVDIEYSERSEPQLLRGLKRSDSMGKNLSLESILFECTFVL